MARKLSEDFVGTCQWCFGEYKVNAQHKVVLHGFTRPGYGYTIGQCRGVGHLPFEYGHDLTEARIAELKEEIANNKSTISKIDAGKVQKVPNPYYISPKELEKKRQSRFFQEPTENLEFLESDHRQFGSVLKRFRANVANRISFDERSLAHFELLLKEWKKGEIVGIDVPATGKKREIAGAYDPDVEQAKKEREAAAKKRAAKPGKINILLYRKAANQFHHLGGDGNDEAAWKERMDALEAYYEEEKDFKKSVRSWAKENFEGKVWVGDAYSGDYGRGDPESRNGAWVAVNLKVDWQHLDDILALFPEGQFVRRNDNSPKDVRLLVRGEAFPKGL